MPILSDDQLILFERLVSIAKAKKIRSFRFGELAVEFMPNAFPIEQNSTTYEIPRTGIPEMFPEDET